jgi:hypothetical protein
MSLQDQVCELETAKKLKELGLPQECTFVWWSHPITGFDEVVFTPVGEYQGEVICSAPGTGELGLLVAEWVKVNGGTYAPLVSKRDNEWHVNLSSYHFKHPKLAEALAKFVIFLIEDGHIKVKK